MVTLKKCSFLVITWILFYPVRSQSSDFNQYNGSLALLNPAFISSIDKEQFSYLFRDQWPGYRLGKNNQAITFNKHIARLNSSFGLTYEKTKYHQIDHQTQRYGLQYAYRVLFMSKYILNFGATVLRNEQETDVTNYDYKFEPKKTYENLEKTFASKNSFQLNYGFIFQEKTNQFSAGFCYQMNSLNYGVKESNLTLHQGDSWKIHSMFRFESLDGYFFLSGIVEHVNASSVDGATEKMLTPEGTNFQLQANLHFTQKLNLGLGYKHFEGNYGVPFYRLSISPDKNRVITFGYSYDVLPYIQYDRLNFYSSHELYIKLLLPYRTNN